MKRNRPDEAEEQNPLQPDEAPQDDLELLRAQLEQAQQEMAKLEEMNLRLRAEFDNFRKRVRQEQALDRQRGKEEFVLDLLPIVDNFERAVEAAKTTQSFEAMADGVNGILRQVLELFRRNEIEPINATGQPFDPAFHDAIQRVENSDLPDNTVVAEAERGYKMGDRVIRPSRVLVAVRPDNAE